MTMEWDFSKAADYSSISARSDLPKTKLACRRGMCDAYGIIRANFAAPFMNAGKKSVCLK